MKPTNGDLPRLSGETAAGQRRPIKVLQYGEGNFLRAFADWMLDIANEKTDFNGGVVIVKPAPFGNLNAFHEQDCRYTVMLRGLKDGKKFEETRVVTSVSKAVDPFEDYAAYAALAKEESLQFIISNTTEAGISPDEGDLFEMCPPRSFPGKVCKLLYERAEHFNYAENKGVVLLPVELIDDNGAMLKKYVLWLAEKWGLGEKFVLWLNNACVFASTLVDRIVTGYPKGEDESIFSALGYRDSLLVTAEPFGLWVIESEKDLSRVLPLPACGLPVIFTDDQKPYKQRKVRILNGAHTSFVPMAYLLGHDDVLGAMSDNSVRAFMEGTVRKEVIPTLSLPKDDLESFAAKVTERFMNPFIRHLLLSICLNSVSKWRARCLPSLLGYLEKFGRLPERLTFSLAALTALYAGGEKTGDGRLRKTREGKEYFLQDESAVIDYFSSTPADAENLARGFLQNEMFFGRDLTAVPGLLSAVETAYRGILKNGMKAAFEARFGEKA